MKVLILNSTASGGAANAARRLSKGLKNKNIEVDFLTIDNFKETTCSYFKKRRIIKEQFKLLKFKSEASDYFSSHESYYSVNLKELLTKYDIIHLHWVNNLLDLRELAHLNRTIVWTLHDKNLFTGGCHYSFGCDSFSTTCILCPQLPESIFGNLANRIFNLKKKIFDRLSPDNIIFVTPSNWLKEEVEKSALLNKFATKHIFNGIGESDFYIVESDLRARWQLTNDVKVILFLATDLTSYRKGYGLFKEALMLLDNILKETVYVLLVGSGDTSKFEEYKNVKFLFAGHLNEKELLCVYNGCDFLILPTLEDNLPNTVIEAHLCGLPVLGFDIGGMSELINSDNGLLLEDISSTSLLNGILYMLNNLSRYNAQEISDNTKSLFSEEKFVEKHVELYNQTRQK